MSLDTYIQCLITYVLIKVVLYTAVFISKFLPFITTKKQINDNVSF